MNKLLLLFWTKAVSATFAIEDTDKQDFDSDMNKCGARITHTATPQERTVNSGRPQTTWGIAVENVDTKFIDMYKAVTFTVQFNDGIRAEFLTNEKVISTVYIKMKNSRDEWHSMINIHSNMANILKGISNYYINFGGCGNINSFDAKEFALGLNLAAQVVDELKALLPSEKQ